MSSATIVVVPMKDPAASKTRLNAALGSERRASLARLLFKRTLSLLGDLQQSHGFALAVVTESAEIAELAKGSAAAVIKDPSGGLNPALTSAGDYAAAAQFERLCILPADLAAPDPSDLERVIGFAPVEKAAVICPAADGGTNALLVAPPNALPFQFGPGSAKRHAEAAEAHGLTPVMMPLESLAFDIDTAEDLARAVRIVPELRPLP